MENVTIIQVVELTTFAFHTNPSMTGTAMAISTQHTCTEPSMKFLSTMETLSKKVFIITTRLVLSALSNHVVHCWWCPQGMTVLLDGPRSITGTWWLTITTTLTKKISSVLTKTQSIFMVATPAEGKIGCTLWKGTVDHFLAFRMSSIESWHALSAPSKHVCTFRRSSFLIKSVE